MRTDQVSPFMIDIATDVLSDLRRRLKNTRWSYQVAGTNWDAGTDLGYLQELTAYWQDGYDWRKSGGGAQSVRSFQDHCGRYRHPLHP
jgi:Epoxide hydrolase N terminus